MSDAHMKVKISDIVIPEQRARSSWSEEQKQMLEGAVKEYGQLSDPLVRPLPEGKYELVDGES
ncbi:MAG: chromosome partitioning protein ParB, partial [Candidatus Thorarchaeota archaeon]